MRHLTRKVVQVSSGSGQVQVAGRHRLDGKREQIENLDQIAGMLRGE